VLRELRRRGFLDDRSRDERKPNLRILARSNAPRNIATEPKVLEARTVWHSARKGAGSPLETYFLARALPLPPPLSVRFVPHYTWRRTGDLVLPAMIVAVQSPFGEIICIEATALTPRCDRKAFADARDKTGIMGAGAARFAAATEILGLAEGAETAIAAQATMGVPTWACLGAGRMASVAIPDMVRRLIIFADDDPPGRQAAERTAERHRHISVEIHLPPAGKDWNDALMLRRSVA
jgi:hypothetical protein